MTDHGYIYIPNWDKYQHYKDNARPAWIKLYTELLDRDDYRELSLAERGLLHNVWMLISRVGNGNLKCDSRSLGSRLGVRRVSLEPLIHAGFIEVRSRDDLDQRREETEKEERREEPISMVSSRVSLTEDQDQAMSALMATIGDAADEKTIITVRRRVEQLSPADVWDVREGLRECQPRDRARYAVALLMIKTGEIAA